MIDKLMLLLSAACLVFLPFAQDEKKLIESTWIAVGSEVGGEKVPDEGLKDVKLILKDGRYTFQDDRGTYSLGPATDSPRTMDMTGTEGPNKGKTYLAIFELNGDTLRICADLTGKTRPTEFATKAGTLLLLASYKRAVQ